MPTFLTTIKFTDQGIRKIQDTGKRASAFKAMAKKMGVKVVNIYWTLGAIDGAIIFDAPDEETATALMLQLTSLGNLKTQTSRAFDAAEMNSILSKLSE